MTMNAKWWQKLTWRFGSGELKNNINIEENHQRNMPIIFYSKEKEKIQMWSVSKLTTTLSDFISKTESFTLPILWKYFYSLAPIFMVSTKCIDPWVLEFMVSNTTCTNQWESCISLDFYFRCLSEPRNPWKLESHD